VGCHDPYLNTPKIRRRKPFFFSFAFSGGWGWAAGGGGSAWALPERKPAGGNCPGCALEAGGAAEATTVGWLGGASQEATRAPPPVPCRRQFSIGWVPAMKT